MSRNWIVVVDDDIETLKNARVLLSDEDMRVSAVSSGKDLIAFMQKNDPDLIILDIVMPEMDGFATYEAIRKLEKEEGRRETPVIFLTGEVNAKTEEIGLRLGASDFIRKPLNKDIVLQRIKNTILNTETIVNLTEEAMTDKLTGFFNKSATEQKMTDLCMLGYGMMMILDLDNFKLVNDIYGHEMGDRVLESFADITKKNTRANDVLCRIGGDEFLVFFVNTNDEHAVQAFSRRLNDSLIAECKRLMGDEFNVPIGVSVGCVHVTKEGGDYKELFSYADKALYQVKQNGKHGYSIYDPDDFDPNEVTNAKVELEHMITLCEERGRIDEAMLVGRDAFVWTYRFMMRYAKRYRRTVTKMLISMDPAENMKKEEFLIAVDEFADLLKKTLRKNDVITKSKKNSFFILLPEQMDDRIEENTDIIITRIMKKWEKNPMSKRIKISYATDSV